MRASTTGFKAITSQLVDDDQGENTLRTTVVEEDVNLNELMDDIAMYG